MAKVTVPRTQLFAAIGEGVRARRDHDPVESCPYLADGTKVEKVLRGAWMNAFVGDYPPDPPVQP